MMARLLPGFLALFIFFLSLPLRAEDFGTQARNAILVDATTGAVLMAKGSDVPIPPASMSKLMTVNMVFEALKSGRLSLEDAFAVSEKAWKMGGSKMFVRVGDRISVENLLRGTIIQSGNDACIVLAEGLAGSEEDFARRMTQRAQELGLRQSTFRNATGWPAEGHRMSVRDLAKLARHIIETYPEYYPLYSERSFTWEGISQRNRNPLLALDVGADGLKTGHTEEAGYGLVGSAVRNGRRLIVVIAGLPSARERALEAERLLGWGFREFETVDLLTPGAKVGSAAVWIGTEDRVPLMIKEPIKMTTRFGTGRSIRAATVINGPIEAPITKGQQLGVLRLIAPNVAPIEVPLYAAKDIERGGIFDKLKAGALLMIESGLRALTGAPAPGTQPERRG